MYKLLICQMKEVEIMVVESTHRELRLCHWLGNRHVLLSLGIISFFHCLCLQFICVVDELSATFEVAFAVVDRSKF